MRIVHIGYMHPHVVPGGAQQVAFELFQASLALGHEAYLISALEAYHEEVYGKPGAPIVPVHGEPRQYFYFPQHYDFAHLSVGDWRSVKFLKELLERLKPDVIHFHHYHRIGVESFRAARLAAPNAVISLTFHEMMAICSNGGQMVKVKTRALCHEATPIACNKCYEHLRPEFFTLRADRLKALLNECDLFIFPSEFIADRYVHWGLPSRKCVVIYNGQVDLRGSFDSKSCSQALNRFGFFGQFIDNKGIEIVLKALLILGRENRVPPCGIVFEINGSNKEFATSAYLTQVKGILDELQPFRQNGIHIVDRERYDRHELVDRMKTIDWVLVPSTWWEVFGLVISEAWMFGRPVVAADIGGIGERVKHGENGFTFPVRDARALADLMANLIGNSERWTKANAAIPRTWTDRDMANAYLEVWKETKPQAP